MVFFVFGIRCKTSEMRDIVAAFSCNEMGIIDIDLNDINLDDSNYDEDDSKTIIHIRHLAWHINFKKREAHRKYKHGINANSVTS